MRAVISLFVLTILCTGLLNAQTTYRFASGEMSIAGTSSIHDWESAVEEVQIEGAFVFAENKLTDIEGLTVSVPVKSIISGRGSIMDNKTWKALKSEEYPNILFTLNKVASVEPADDGLLLKLEGVVTIAGVEKTIEMEVAGQALADGQMAFEGAQPIKMTDFGIDPPTALFGTLITGDDVTVKFKAVMAPAEGKL